jgi:hypothetical protein
LLGSRASVRVARVVRAEAVEARAICVLLRLIPTRIRHSLPISRIHVAGVVGTNAVKTWRLCGLLLQSAGGISPTVEATLHFLTLWRSALASVAEEALVGPCPIWNRPRAHLPVGRTETLTRRCHGVRASQHTRLPQRSGVESLLLRRHSSAAKLIRSHRTDPGPHVFVGQRPANV